MSTSITSTTAATTNPAITDKDIIEFRRANLGFSATVSNRYKDKAGVGTTIRWATTAAPNSGAARTKSEGNSGNDITYDVNTEGSVTLAFNQHYYSAYEIEEFEESLSIVDLRSVYTRGAAYVVEMAVDDALAALPDDFTSNAGIGTLAVPWNDDDIRDGVRQLDDANVPADDRFFAMSPAAKMSLMGIDRYASSDFNRGGGANIIKGEFGQIYNLRPWQSTNIEGSNAAGHDNAIYHRDAMALGMRMKPKVRNFDDIQNLSSQHSVSVIFGVIETRDDHGVYARGE